MSPRMSKLFSKRLNPKRALIKALVCGAMQKQYPCQSGIRSKKLSYIPETPQKTPALDMKRDSFVDYVLDQLHEVGTVECRSMFGGFGLYAGGKFFGIIFKNRLYFKTSEETRTAYASRSMRPFRPGAKQELKSYYEVPADVVEDARELVHWAMKASNIPSDKP